MNPLVLGALRKSRDAAIFASGIIVFVWAFGKLNPASLINEAEGRQMKYVDDRLAEKEKLDNQRHYEQLRAVQRIDDSMRQINQKIDRIMEVQNIKTRR